MTQLAGIGLAILSPALALATNAPTLPGTDIQGPEGVFKVICSLVNWLFAVLVLIAVIFVFIAAFRYLTTAGEPEKLSKANKTLVYAAVAIGVALLARVVPMMVAGLLGVSVSGGSFFFVWSSCLT